MNRSDLVQELSALNPDLGTNAIDKIVKNILHFISNHIANGSRVEIRGFASFSLKQRNTGFVRNPRYGTVEPSQPRNVVYFRPGKELKTRVNYE